MGLLLSVALHFAAFRWLDLGTLLPTTPADETVRVVELPPLDSPTAEATPEARPPEAALPADPVEVPRPALPVPGPVELSEAPEWTPHDVPPRLVNPEQVRGLIMARYRARATEAGGLEAEEGRTVLWLYVDDAGRVRKMQLRRSSGSEELDGLARKAAGEMRFRPALFRGRTVPVWISQPIRFAGPLDAGVRTARVEGASEGN